MPDGTPVIVSSGGDGAVRVWRQADRTRVGYPLGSHGSRVRAVTVGALPDGTAVVVGGSGDGAVRAWRLADGTLLWQSLRGHDGRVRAVAVGALPDGTPVAVSGGIDGAVRVWQLADGSPLAPPLDLSGRVSGFAVHGNIIVTAVGPDIAVHELAGLGPG